jgi:hypothetical protein
VDDFKFSACLATYLRMDAETKDESRVSACRSTDQPNGPDRTIGFRSGPTVRTGPPPKLMVSALPKLFFRFGNSFGSTYPVPDTLDFGNIIRAPETSDFSECHVLRCFLKFHV